MDPHPECVKKPQGPPPCKFNYCASLAQSDNYNPGIKILLKSALLQDTYKARKISRNSIS